MKSQKQTNKAPRPFKTYNSDRWSGGRSSDKYIPGGKAAAKPKKASPPEASPPMPAAEAPPVTD